MRHSAIESGRDSPSRVFGKAISIVRAWFFVDDAAAATTGAHFILSGHIYLLTSVRHNAAIAIRF